MSALRFPGASQSRRGSDTSRSRDTPRFPRAPERSRTARSRCRCRTAEDSVAASSRRTRNAGRPPFTRYSLRMSGVFAKRLPRKYSTHRACVSSSKYSRSSHALFFHVKYVYDIVKPSLAELFIRLGRVNASAKKITSGCVALHVAIIHSQNANGFVCGLSTRKVVHAVLDPEQQHVAARVPEALAIVAPEVQRIDVLILLRRILGVLDRAVRTNEEPVGMLLAPTDGRASIAARSRARSRVRDRAPSATSASKSVDACRARARSPCDRRARCRSPTDCRRHPAPAASELFLPLRNVRPIG